MLTSVNGPVPVKLHETVTTSSNDAVLDTDVTKIVPLYFLPLIISAAAYYLCAYDIYGLRHGLATKPER